MKLSDYMLLRHPKGRGKALTAKEASILGIEYTSGWYNRNKNMEVVKYLPQLRKYCPQHMKSKLLALEISYREIKHITNEKYLYVMENENGLIKIGISKHPHKRAIDLSHQSGITVTIKKIYDVGLDARNIENCLHKYFKKYRLIGEWFINSLTIEDIEKKLSQLCIYKEAITTF